MPSADWLLSMKKNLIMRQPSPFCTFKCSYFIIYAHSFVHYLIYLHKYLCNGRVTGYFKLTD